VALVGRPNVGKTTLLCALVGEKIAAITPKPQTTRRRLRAILTLAGAQVVLVDTPGMFDGAVVPGAGRGGYGQLGAFMAREARAALTDVDVIAWIVEPVDIDDAHRAIGRLIAQAGRPCVLCINKIDLVAKPRLLPMLDAWGKLMPFAALVPLSAARASGLDRLVLELGALLAAGPALFPATDLTDAPERELVSEMIREKAMLLTGQEVPYAIAVEIERFDEARRQGRRPLVEIDAAIHVERAGQKAIVVGKGGEKAKQIGTSARQDIERLLGCRVMLRLFVKVSEGWSRSQRGLGAMGYR
jgi:GTP-binding protein Era